MIYPKLAALLSISLLTSVLSLSAAQAETTTKAERDTERAQIKADKCKVFRDDEYELLMVILNIKQYLAKPENANDAGTNVDLTKREADLLQVQADIRKWSCPDPIPR